MKDKLREMVVAPADNVATRIIVQVQTATTKVKRLITKAVMENWTQEDLVRELNKTIAKEVGQIQNKLVAEQTRKSLVSSSKKWYYELKESMNILNRNIANSGVNVGQKPIDTLAYARKQLNSGEMKGRPIIENYYKQVKIALKTFATDPPMYAVRAKDGSINQIALRNAAEMTVRYEANIKDVQGLVNKGVKLVWTSSHPNCSPRCKDYQGRLWSLDGTSGVINGIKYSPIQEALEGKKKDGNGIINGYNCRHRLIEYRNETQAPREYTEAEIKQEYAIDKRQRAFENNIRHMKIEEMELREIGDIKAASALRKRWRRLTQDYKIYSLQHGRAYYPYRCVIDRDIENGELGDQQTT